MSHTQEQVTGLRCEYTGTDFESHENAYIPAHFFLQTNVNLPSIITEKRQKKIIIDEPPVTTKKTQENRPGHSTFRSHDYIITGNIQASSNMVNSTTLYYLHPFKYAIPAVDAEQWLGRIVVHDDNPESNYTPQDTSTARGQVVEFSGYEYVKLQIEVNEGSWGILRPKRNSTRVAYNSTGVKRLQLQQYPDIFERVQELPGVRDWLERNCKANKSVYMITRLLVAEETVFHARSEESARQRETRGGLHSPHILAIEYKKVERENRLSAGARYRLNLRDLKGPRFFGGQASNVDEVGEAKYAPTGELELKKVLDSDMPEVEEKAQARILP